MCGWQLQVLRSCWLIFSKQFEQTLLWIRDIIFYKNTIRGKDFEVDTKLARWLTR